MLRGNTHMLDIMSSPQSIERPTMTVPSLATTQLAAHTLATAKPRRPARP
jgi:hypothetical protein